jgi:hypothetical protein
MLEEGLQLQLVLEAAQGGGRHTAGFDHFQGNGPVGVALLRLIDSSHAANAQLGEDVVPRDLTSKTYPRHRLRCSRDNLGRIFLPVKENGGDPGPGDSALQGAHVEGSLVVDEAVQSALAVAALGNVGAQRVGVGRRLVE